MAVASSSTRTSGSMASIPAMAIRCFWPPESIWGALLAYFSIPTAFNASFTRRRISSGGTPRFSGPKATSSSTMVVTIWLSGFWNTIPTFLRIFRVFASTAVSIPSTVTCPSVGRSSALRCFARVLLPLPLWPTMASISPLFISSEISLRAVCSSSYL